MKDCISVFHEILNQMPQSQGAFNIAKESLGKQLASLRTTKSAVFNAWIRAKKLGLDYDLNEKIYKALPAMQLKDIVDFEKANMANKAYRYIILGDEKELDMKTLEKIGPIKRLTIDEIFGE
jgi:predicted Zn-dependent peptidase